MVFLLALNACAPPDPVQPAPPPTADASPFVPPVEPTPSLPAPTTSVSPTATPVAAEGCAETRGAFQDETLASQELGKDLSFRIYFPPCYASQVDVRYPVLYLFHGQTYQDDQWDRLGIDEAAEGLVAAGEAPPFIMVFPYDPGWRQPSQDLFGEAVATELVPWVDAHTRSLADREHRAAGGLSRGAGWAIHLAFTHPDLFSRVGAHSLALFWEDADGIPLLLRDLPSDSLPDLYLDAGRSDRELQSTQEFEEMLTAHNIAHEWVLNLGYHDEDYWSAHVEQYLRFYTRGWLVPSR